MRSLPNTQKQQGFTLVELMLVITIIAILLGASLETGAFVSPEKYAAEQSQLNRELAERTRNYYRYRNDYSTVTNATATTNGLVPSYAQGAANSIRASNGTTITITGTANDFRLQMTMNTAECASLLPKLSIDTTAITVSNGATTTTVQDVIAGTDYSPTVAAGACNIDESLSVSADYR